jgi:hypothetical protein
MVLTEENQRIRRETRPNTPLCPPQIPHGLIRARTRASTARGQRLTAWAMAWPVMVVCEHKCRWRRVGNRSPAGAVYNQRLSLLTELLQFNMKILFRNRSYASSLVHRVMSRVLHRWCLHACPHFHLLRWGCPLALYAVHASPASTRRDPNIQSTAHTPAHLSVTDNSLATASNYNKFCLIINIRVESP